jgi:hypothetical protein
MGAETMNTFAILTPENTGKPQIVMVAHRAGSDAVRYAIAIQQLRDAKDYAAADRARALVEAFGYVVKQMRDRTIVGLDRGMHVQDDVLYDAG